MVRVDPELVPASNQDFQFHRLRLVQVGNAINVALFLGQSGMDMIFEECHPAKLN